MVSIASEGFGPLLGVVIGHVRESSHDGWGQRRSTDEIVSSLEELVARARAGDVDREAMRYFFVATGELPELSIANGWADEFVGLSSQVDALLVDL